MNLLDVLKNPAARVPHPVPGDAVIKDLPDPDVVTIPLEYPDRLLLPPVVKAGDRVARNEVIGRSEQGNCIHASISGTVREISRIWTPSGHHVPAVVIEKGDGPDLTPAETLARCNVEASSATRVELLKACGVTSPWTTPRREDPEGGDAETPDIRHLVIIGHDEDPVQHVQELLLQERAAILQKGMLLLRDVAPNAQVTLTVPRALAAWARETFGDGLRIVGVSNEYRRRLEHVLVAEATGLSILPDVPYRSRGVAVMTVETALAAQEALKGQAFVRKTVTISGGPLAVPLTVRVPMGTAVATILAACGVDTAGIGRILAGGPMRGTALYTDETPVDKFQQGIHLLRDEELAGEVNLTCVNCGRCVRTCPVNLQVHLIGRYVEFNQLAEAAAMNPEACIECGLCAYVCPSRRPLVQLVNIAKTYRRNAS